MSFTDETQMYLSAVRRRCETDARLFYDSNRFNSLDEIGFFITWPLSVPTVQLTSSSGTRVERVQHAE